MRRLDLTADPVDTEDVGIRLDKYLSDRIDDLSRSAIAKLIEDGKVTIGDKPGTKTGEHPARHRV